MSLRATLIASWRARTARERLFLGSAGSILAVALLYGLIWQPGAAARQQLAATLPAMRAQLEDMRLQQKEVIALRKEIESTPQRGDLKALLHESAMRSVFGRSVERVEAVAADRVAFAAGPIGFDAWLDWAAGVQREFGARVETSKIVTAKPEGMVRVEATFAARSSSETRLAP